MSIDNDPENRLFEQIEAQKKEQEVEKQRLMSEKLHQKLKDLGVVADIWAGKLSEVEEEKLPEVDSLLRESLKEARIKHDVLHIPEREN